MAFTFRKISRDDALPNQATNTGFLVENNWDDFGFSEHHAVTFALQP